MRITVRRMMVAVAVLAVSSGGAIAIVRRPSPTDTFHVGHEGQSGIGGSGTLSQAWSDGWIIAVQGEGQDLKDRQWYGPVMRARWGDGSRSWSWRPEHRVATPHKQRYWDGSRTWHWDGTGGLGGGQVSGPYPDEFPPKRP